MADELIGNANCTTSTTCFYREFCVEMNLGENIQYFLKHWFVVGYKIRIWRQGEVFSLAFRFMTATNGTWNLCNLP